MNAKVLIVDDEPSILWTLKEIFEEEDLEPTTAETAEEAIHLLQKHGGDFFQVVLLDIWLPKMDGMQLLEKIKKQYPVLPVIMMSGHGNIETAVKATKTGAYDFIEKPLSLEKVLLTVTHALKESFLERENEELKRTQTVQSYDIIGETEQVKDILGQIKLAAPSDGWVLIHGENGSGKELVARQIHLQSLRKNKPFIEMNCAAIPEELIESELFGHEKGSFTGAVNTKKGKFEQSRGGTLFLDEIGDMSLKTQAKILRVLEEQRFERVGGVRVVEVDVRIIAASNKDLPSEIKAGNFREDLFYRLNVIPIEVPPLRDRKEDIPILIDHFLELVTRNYNYPPKKIDKAAVDAMTNYRWPGNIRELKNIVERMVIMVQNSIIRIEHVPPVIRTTGADGFSLSDFPETFKGSREAFEKQFILTMLKKNKWNISKTAEAIQLERSNLHKKIKLHEITIPKE